MQPSSFPASIGDAAIVSAASARADHSHVPQDIAGFRDSVAEIASEGPEIEFSAEVKAYSSSTYDGDQLEPGMYAVYSEFYVVANPPITGSGSIVANARFSLPRGTYHTAWAIDGSQKMSGSDYGVKQAGETLYFAANSDGSRSVMRGLLFVNGGIEFYEGGQNLEKGCISISGPTNNYSIPAGTNVTATLRIKLRKLA